MPAADPMDYSLWMKHSGQWNDITSGLDDRFGLSIKYGQPDEHSESSPTAIGFTLDNRSGDWSPDNPESQYYHQIGRGTRVRVCYGAAPTCYLRIWNTVYTNVVTVSTSVRHNALTTPDHADLSFTGGMALRIHVEPQSWSKPHPGDEYDYVWWVSKWDEAIDHRSYRFGAKRLSGDTWTFVFQWNDTGDDFDTYELVTTTQIEGFTDDVAVQAVFVPNGASSGTDPAVSFYSSDGMDGTFTLVETVDASSGDPNTIFDGTAEVRIGDTSPWIDVDSDPGLFNGKVYGFRAYTGSVDPGNIVSNLDFTGRATAGDHVFTDDQGHVWEADGSVSTIEPTSLGTGEVVSWVPEFDESGGSRIVRVRAQGLQTRLAREKSAAPKSLARRYLQSADGTVAYWPMEDTALTSAIRVFTSPTGAPTGSLLGDATGIDYGAVSIDGSFSLPTLDDVRIHFDVPEYPAVPNGSYHTLSFILQTPSAFDGTYPSTTGAPQNARAFARAHFDGTDVERVYVGVGNDSGVKFYLIGRAPDSTVLFTRTFSGTPLVDSTYVITIYAYQLDSSVAVFGSSWMRVGTDSVVSNGADVLNPADFTNIVDANIGTEAGMDGDLWGYGHTHVAAGVPLGYLYPREIVKGPLNLWSGERTGERLVRLGRQDDERPIVLFHDSPSELLSGQQSIAPLPAAQNSVNADLGILRESKSASSLEYLAKIRRYNATPVMTFSTTNGTFTNPFEPATDISKLVNQLEISDPATGRIGFYAKTSGPNNVHEREDDNQGAGRQPDSKELSILDADQLIQIAAFEVNLSTVDEPRIASLTMEVHHNTDLIAAMVAINQGNWVRFVSTLEGLPANYDFVVFGWDDIFSVHTWYRTFHLGPAAGWKVMELDSEEYGRLDNGFSRLTTAVDTTQTEFRVQSLHTPWIYSSEHPALFPFDLNIGGERMSVSAITNAVEDTFTRVESNGWGTPDAGPIWTDEGAGVAADYSVDGATGLITMGAADVQHVLTVDPSWRNTDQIAKFSFDKAPTGAGQQAGLVARFTDSSNYYFAILDFAANGNAWTYLLKYTAGALSVLQLVIYTNELPFVADQDYTVRFSAFESSLRAKFWKSSGPEPYRWSHSVTDTDHADGRGGVYGALVSGHTGAPVVLSVDDYQMQSPQDLTVTRSVNEVTKTHSAGDEVHLWTPARLAL